MIPRGGPVFIPPPSLGPKQKKPKGTSFHFPVHSGSEALEDIQIMASPVGWLFGRHKKTKKAGDILQAVGQSPVAVATHPVQATKDLGSMARGLLESPIVIGSSIKKIGFIPTMQLLWHATKTDYSTRYGANWKEEARKHPLFNLADALMVIGPALKAGEIASAFGRLGRLDEAGLLTKEARAARGALVKGGKEAKWENLTPREKLRISREEAKHPGTMTRGVPDTRHLEVNIAPAGKPPKLIWSDQALATGPLRRSIQHTFDALAEQFPDMKGFGAKSRIMRAQQRNRVRVIDRMLSGVTDVGALKGLNEAARTRAFWEAQMPPARTAEEATANLKRLRQYLTDEYRSTNPKPGDSMEFHDWLQNMKQAGFGDALLKRLDKAIEYTPDNKYNRAMTALRQMTGIGEQIIHDTRMFSPLKNERTRTLDQIRLLEKAGSDPEMIQSLRDKVAMLEEKLVGQSDRALEMMHNRRGLVADAVNIGTPINAPERARWEQFLAKEMKFTPPQVEDAMQAFDMFARGSGDPVRFFRDRVGNPSKENWDQFASRVGSGAYYQGGGTFDRPFGSHLMIEGEDVLHPLPDSPYYSGVQKQIDNIWGKKGQDRPLPVAQVKKALLNRQIVSEDAYRAAELDNFFDQFPDPKTLITREQLQRHLATPLNQYNIMEHHYVNLPDAYPNQWPLWGGAHTAPDTPFNFDWESELLARSPKQGEYHEFMFQFPDGLRHAATDYGRTGAGHWQGAANVVAHARFQVFKEGGVKKLLIEEVQSDWLSDLRKQEKAGRTYDPAALNEWQARYDELDDAAFDASMDADAVEQELNQLHDAIANRRRYGGPDAEGNIPEIEKKIQDAETRLAEADRIATEKQNEVRKLWESRPGDVPPEVIGHRRAMRLGVHRALRFAGENGVDEVIVVDRYSQHARNMHVPQGERSGEAHMRWQDALNQPGAMGEYTLEGDWIPAEGRTPAEARAMADDLNLGGDSFWARAYEKDIPEMIEKRVGVKGGMVDDAYQGHLAIGAAMGERTATGPMRGYRIVLNDEARAKATTPEALFQKQPEWGDIPRGANELLKDGRRAIHLFEKADISTIIHELAHSAVYDLLPEEKLVLENYYGAGKSIDKWDRGAHENFARDVERYFREGTTPHKLLTDVFERIKAWMNDVYRAVKGKEPDAIPPAVEDVFRKMVSPRGETPEIFMPHRALPPDLAGTRMASGIPRRAREVGDRVDLRYPIFKENKLALLRSGLINDDPRLLVEHVNRLVSVQRANQLREFVLEHATPLDPRELPLVDYDKVYVVKETGTSPHKALFDAIEGADNPEEIRQSIANFTDAHFITNKSEASDLAQQMERMGAEAWRGDNRLYTIDKQTVDLLFKNATGRGPGATTRLPANLQRIIDTGLNATRSVLLYGNPGFYIANMAGNFGMMMFNDPRAAKFLTSGIRRALTQGKDPVYERVVGEMGRGPTAGGLREPEHILARGALKRPGHAMMNAVDRADYTMLRIGHAAGSAVDNPFRYAAWRQEAYKRGYRTDDQVMKLLDQADEDARGMRSGEADSKAIRDLNAIRDRAEQLMLDFDSLSPTERDVLSRIIFLYPFLKASAKYPFMYAGEHPFTFGAAVQGSNIGSQMADQMYGPYPNLPEWAHGYARTPWGMVNIGSIDQMNVLASELQSLMGVGTPTETGINRPINFLNPAVQMFLDIARQQNRYGRDANIGQIIKSEVPLPNYITQLWRQPSSVYDLPPDASLKEKEIAALIRSLRLFPFPVNQNWTQGGG